MLPLPPSVGRRRIMGSLLMLTLMGAGAAELTLVQEGGPRGTTWGYSLLPSTFPLTWDEARAACEAVPGSMLAKVDGWEAEAAVEEYLKALRFTKPVWLANRQTLPEVLGDEQREMNHIGGVSPGGGRVGVVADDLILGGDVGVTLRCAVYRVGVGVVHELCSASTMTAALCLQRLSSERPLLDECPPSVHRQWLLVTHSTETTVTKGPDETTVSVVGLLPCHHQHHLGHTTCHPQSGWSHTACPPQTSSPKHHRNSRKTHRSHHHDRDGPRLPHRLTHTNDVTEVNRRDKRMARASESEMDKKETREPHSLESTSSSEEDEMRVAPLAKAENLNLDLIESIMRDFNPKKSKADNQDGPKNVGATSSGGQTVVREARMDDAIFEEDQLQAAGATKNPNTHKTNTLQDTEGSEALQNHLNKDVTDEPNKKPDNKESSLSKNNRIPAEPSDGKPSENTDVNTAQKPNNKEQDDDGDRAASSASAPKPDGVSAADRDTQEEKQDSEGKTEAQTEVGAEEEMGPSFTVGVGPIFVEDSQKERTIIEAAKEEQRVNNTMPDELVVRVLEQRQSRDGRKEEEEDTLEENAGGTGQRPIVFPAVPDEAKSDPTPHSDTETVNSTPVNIVLPGEGDTDTTTAQGRVPGGGNGPTPSSPSVPILFPEHDSEPKETNNEAQTAPNNAGVTTQSSITPGGGVPTGQDAAAGPPMTTDLEENSDRETMSETPGVDDEPQKSETSDVSGKPGMADMEGDSEEKDDNGDPSDKPGMDAQSDSDDKDKESDNVGGSNANIEDKPVNPESKETMEEPDDSGTSSSPGTQDSGKETTDESPDEGNSGSGQESTGEGDEDKKSKENGKQALLTQIFTGIFG
ncbi:uncharacterized protein [Panulirus ornatus]|uniref:uncharacterized protein n=1 Tax=Panulirus ornatus TaxID=150431 RepID=UPI003A850AEF